MPFGVAPLWDSEQVAVVPQGALCFPIQDRGIVNMSTGYRTRNHPTFEECLDKIWEETDNYICRTETTLNWFRRRDIYLRSTYGLDIYEYFKIYKGQDGRCWICRKKQKSGSMYLVVDHNHKTGKVRGLLCNGCNSAYGLLGEKRNNIMRLLKYHDLFGGADEMHDE